MAFNKAILLILFFLSINRLTVSGQDHTVGVISYSPWESYDGYNLLFPEKQSTVFLLNNCGQIVHRWPDHSDYISGKVAYLQANGTLVKTKRLKSAIGDSIQGGGQGAIVEIRTWDNELLWQFEQNNALTRLHHDISVMSNGNILMISWEKLSTEQAIAAGRNPNLLIQNQLWPDYILEVNPTLDSIVWEWHVKDHLIQDFDSTKLNYGIVGEHSELIDFNWDTSEGKADWTHVNSIDYNEGLDQIIISVPTFNEFWIIDHSTTMEEAAGHTGGQSGKGGDLLYRWGNPAAYRQGDASHQKLFFQHDVHWIDDFIDQDQPYFGKIALFNNRITFDHSSASILTPVFDTINQRYSSFQVPENFDITFEHPNPVMMVSGIMSGIQILPNGNTLICASRPGYTFEMTPDGAIVWEYKTPFKSGMPVEQGFQLGPSANVTFRLNRYPLDFSAFDGRDLTPHSYIELNPDEAYCDLVLDNKEISLSKKIIVYPNPSTSFLYIEKENKSENHFALVDILGRIRIKTNRIEKSITWNISALENGIYFLLMDGIYQERIIVSK